MCGRFAFFSPVEAITAAFVLQDQPVFEPRYNIAPGQELLAIRRDGERNFCDTFRWGLVPFWAKDPAIGNRMINARAETIAEKPSYRQAYKRRRCLIPASGFYEWAKTDAGKVPWYFSSPDNEPLAFAALWEEWQSPDETALRTCTIVTTVANRHMRDLHHRMPVIVPSAERLHWLQADSDASALARVLFEGGRAELQAWAVSRRVNNPLNDQAELVEPA